MTTEAQVQANKAIVRRFFEEVHNQGDMSVLEALVAPDYVRHHSWATFALGREGLKEWVRVHRSAFPDVRVTVEDLVCEGNKVVARGTDRGTHLGEYLGFAPTGNSFIITWTTILRLEHGRIAEEWTELDMEKFRRQLRLPLRSP